MLVLRPQPAGAQSSVAAVLPSSRSVTVGTPATAFATIINTGSVTASNCRLVPLTSIPATFAFQTTNPATNAVTGTPDAGAGRHAAALHCDDPSGGHHGDRLGLDTPAGVINGTFNFSSPQVVGNGTVTGTASAHTIFLTLNGRFTAGETCRFLLTFSGGR
jgi:hypothetical protein